nr:MAG TPA: hypothetical protein [Caudoviricetes sp.]
MTKFSRYHRKFDNWRYVFHDYTYPFLTYILYNLEKLRLQNWVFDEFYI